ncbi:flagellar hook-length control protein FliK [Shewanella submarina]|uniref:Flagellar hook-length control protein FliK n=1 Tax=Shewanella submarina TaxID=2016376 RepID=A0ABV7GKX7_9GAMM|nr:flagellar hook-length control protein FliK [Shewanella submarina]MCL1036502.1 flagellar hook-length control protein FliK [Shewanella submarina]
MQQVSSILLGGNKAPSGSNKESQGEGFSEMFSEIQKQYQDAETHEAARAQKGSVTLDDTEEVSNVDESMLAQQGVSDEEVRAEASEEELKLVAEEEVESGLSGQEDTESDAIPAAVDLLFAQIGLAQNWQTKPEGGVELPPEGEIIVHLQSNPGKVEGLEQLMTLLGSDEVDPAEIEKLLAQQPELKSLIGALLSSDPEIKGKVDAMSTLIKEGELDLQALSRLTDIPVTSLAKMDKAELQALISKLDMLPPKIQQQLTALIEKNVQPIKAENSVGKGGELPTSGRDAQIPSTAAQTAEPSKTQNALSASTSVTASSQTALSANREELPKHNPDIKLLTPELVGKGEKISLSDAAVQLQRAELTLTAGDAEDAAERVNQLTQNQGAMTQTHRSEVPQFQLSVRQGQEAQVQQQNMVQKFAPLMQQQLVNMVSKGIGQAEIRLDPPELGQMMVRIQVNGDQTQVQFQAMQQQTRDMLEQAIPRLREMLQSQGMELADSQVSSQDSSSGGQGDGEANSASGGNNPDSDENAADAQTSTINPTRTGTSGIDYYA